MYGRPGGSISIKAPKAPRSMGAWENGEGVSPPEPTGGASYKLPQRGPGRSAGRKRFECFLVLSSNLCADS